MLSVLLETMHEDLNSVTKKPYIEQKDSNNRPDEIVAQEFWDGFKKRDSSIFVDQFYGQLKSRVQCSACRYVSITFDPFNVLSVPIPVAKAKERNFCVNYWQESFAKPVLKLQLAYNSDMLVAELKAKVKETIETYNKANDKDV